MRGHKRLICPIRLEVMAGHVEISSREVVSIHTAIAIFHLTTSCSIFDVQCLENNKGGWHKQQYDGLY